MTDVADVPTDLDAPLRVAAHRQTGSQPGAPVEIDRTSTTTRVRIRAGTPFQQVVEACYEHLTKEELAAFKRALGVPAHVPKNGIYDYYPRNFAIYPEDVPHALR